MSCSINKEDLIAFIYGELDEKKRASIKEHIKRCSECAEEIVSLQKERTLLKKWEVEAPQLDFVIVKEKQSFISWIKSYFNWISVKPVRIGYTFAGAILLLLVVLSILNFDFRYDQSGVSFSMSIFGKGKETDVNEELITELMDNQQKFIGIILDAVAESEERIKQERNSMFTQLINEMQRQRENDMFLVGQNIDNLRSLTGEKFRENDEILGSLISFTAQRLAR